VGAGNSLLSQFTAVEPGSFRVLRQIPGRGSITLAGEQAGEGRPIVLVHGLSATRRNVVQGSRHLIKRGYRLIAYDARGHGESDPAPDPSAYEYRDLVADLEAVLDYLELDRPALVGSSMGAATALAYALDHPERVPALVQITPAYTGAGRTAETVADDTWERLAGALEEGGVEGFVEASQPEDLPERWRTVAEEATRQRMERHRNHEGVAAALRAVPYSAAFDGLERLESFEVPTLIVASRDESDWLHPLEVAREYDRRLPNAELVIEDEGQAPIAWQGARLSGVIGDFLERSGFPPQR
jgi:pimeloyl-ACP methyl ester carboxylesterase